jgi:hypothetical protein
VVFNLKGFYMVFRNKKFLFLALFLFVSSTSFILGSFDPYAFDPFGFGVYNTKKPEGPKFPSGKESYTSLNSDSACPFAMSVGTSMSQTHETENTVHPESILFEIQNVVKKLSLEKAMAWLKDKERRWFILRSLPKYTCENGEVIDPEQLDPIADAHAINKILESLAHRRHYKDFSLLEKCPQGEGKILKIDKKSPPKFDDAHKQAMISQLQALHVNNQSACLKGGLSNFRLSLEASDVLKEQSDQIDPKKLEMQADFINKIGNPLLFFHHYANPVSKPHLFEDKKDSKWFADYCAQVLKLSPQVTHVCPISQPVGFSFRVKRETLPPFHTNIDQAKYLENITDAQVQAARAMKAVSPNVKVLVSHQWKSMKPLHTSMADPRRALELGICKIANKMYNGKFVELIAPHSKEFDGIALSVYPAIRFNLWAPDGDNCAGKIDYEASLEAIVETSKAFPGKDIYVVEAGCNTKDPETKRQFIDMMLHACKVARDQGIVVKGLYLWGQNNDKDFYSEWNFARGTTDFAPFDRLDPENPTGSINAGGVHIQHILGDKK